MNPIDLTCTDIARIVATREMTSSEIVAALVQRTQETLHYNAYSSFDGNLVLRAAEEADRAMANGKKLGILHGVPVALKDSINAVGYLGVLTKLIASDSQKSRRVKAITALSALVGAVSLARAVNDEKLSREILKSVADELKAQLG
ncbi:amidase family protein [Pseudomonas sp. LT1P18]|uniref:amidase family protein n=1 Tax=Pseudomonas arabinosi TaxID=3398357 RepID=UPI0039EEC979